MSSSKIVLQIASVLRERPGATFSDARNIAVIVYRVPEPQASEIARAVMAQIGGLS